MTFGYKAPVLDCDFASASSLPSEFQSAQCLSKMSSVPDSWETLLSTSSRSGCHPPVPLSSLAELQTPASRCDFITLLPITLEPSLFPRMSF